MSTPAPSHEPVPVRETFSQVLNLIEHFWDAKNNVASVWTGEEALPDNLKAEADFLLAERDHGQLWKQVWAPYGSAVVFRFPTVWCCRKHDPVTWLFMVVCLVVKLHPQDIYDAFLSESSLRRLKKVAAKLRGSQLRMMDATETEDFWLFLENAAQNEGTKVVFCDWQLDGDEQQAIQAITKHKNILFAWPE